MTGLGAFGRSGLRGLALCGGFAAALLLHGCGSERDDSPKSLPFLWGTATAGFQVDMGCSAPGCTDASSDWWVWVHDQRNIAEHYTSGDVPEDGPGHWERYQADLNLAAQELGTNAYRFSIEWGRIFPSSTAAAGTPEQVAALADRGAVEHYREMLAAIRRRGMEPIVTLHHYTIPLWAHDPLAYREMHAGPPAYEPQPPYVRSGRLGWLEPEFMRAEFAKYARFIADEFGDQVDLWVTLNEPLAVVTTGFLLFQPGLFGRTNPPGVFDPDASVTAYYAMMDAHAAAYHAIHEADDHDSDGDGKPCLVGIVNNFTPFEPTNPADARHQQAATNADYYYNRVLLNALVRGRYDLDLDGTPETERPTSVGTLDFAGLNYYTRTKVSPAPINFAPHLPVLNFYPTVVWQYAPQGLREVIGLLEEYELPVLITENGYGFPAPDNPSPEVYLLEHLGVLLELRESGSAIMGYCYWSLLDNLEWNEGWRVQMGLYSWDRESKARQAKGFSEVYAAIIRENAVTPAMWAEWGE